MMKKNEYIFEMCILIIYAMVFFVLFKFGHVFENNDLEYKYGEYPAQFEFVRTKDYAYLFDEGLYRQYMLSFDARSDKEGMIKVYFHNGDSTSKYKYETFVELSNEYEHYDIIIEPELVQDASDKAYLTFDGGFGSDIKAIVKNINIYGLPD